MSDERDPEPTDPDERDREPTDPDERDREPTDPDERDREPTDPDERDREPPGRLDDPRVPPVPETTAGPGETDAQSAARLGEGRSQDAWGEPEDAPDHADNEAYEQQRAPREG